MGSSKKLKQTAGKKNLTVISYPAAVGGCDIDIVVIPENREEVLVHSSGVHGVEGYTSSAIQTAFLEQYERGDD